MDHNAVRRAVKHFDTDGNGVLDHEEFKKMMCGLGDDTMSDAEFEETFALVDTNNDGLLQLEELFEWFGLDPIPQTPDEKMDSLVGAQSVEHAVQCLFECFDEESCGYLNAAQVTVIFGQASVMKKMDEDKDGRVDKGEWSAFVLSGGCGAPDNVVDLLTEQLLGDDGGGGSGAGVGDGGAGGEEEIDLRGQPHAVKVALLRSCLEDIPAALGVIFECLDPNEQGCLTRSKIIGLFGDAKVMAVMDSDQNGMVDKDEWLEYTLSGQAGSPEEITSLLAEHFLSSTDESLMDDIVDADATGEEEDQGEGQALIGELSFLFDALDSEGAGELDQQRLIDIFGDDSILKSSKSAVVGKAEFCAYILSGKAGDPAACIEALTDVLEATEDAPDGGNDAGPADSVDMIIAECFQQSSPELDLSAAPAGSDCDAGPLVALGISLQGQVPPTVWVLSHITSLNLAGNGLTSVAGLGKLAGLVTLNCSQNELVEMPEMDSLTALEELDISENKIKTLPPSIGLCKSLVTINAFKNQFAQLPEELGNCSCLEEMNFFNNKLIKIPATFAKLASLKNLNLGSNKIKTLPKTDLWTSLEELRVGSNNLVMLPTFANMTALTFLKLDQNKALGELPEFPPNVENLEVQSTRCTALPKSIESMTALKTLNASSCALEALPDLCKLSALDTLNVSTNKLTTLPGISECGSLRVLLFQGNKVEQGPELSGLFSLERVMCGDNPLSAVSRQQLQEAEEICRANGGWMKGL